MENVKILIKIGICFKGTHSSEHEAFPPHYPKRQTNNNKTWQRKARQGKACFSFGTHLQESEMDMCKTTRCLIHGAHFMPRPLRKCNSTHFGFRRSSHDPTQLNWHGFPGTTGEADKLEKLLGRKRRSILKRAEGHNCWGQETFGAIVLCRSTDGCLHLSKTCQK